MTTLTADIAVVGAGVIGAASAWRLAERGLEVLVLEQASPASGSTGRSAAGVRQQFTTETNIRLARESIREYPAMPEAGYTPVGYLMLVPHDQWPAHQRAVALQQRLGVPSELLTPLEAQRHAGFLPGGLGGCSFCATDGFVDPHRLTCDGYRADRGNAAAHHPGRHRPGAPAAERGGRLGGRLGALVGLSLPVRPARRMVFTTGPLDPTRRLPMVFDLASGVWLRSEGERLILGRADPADVGRRSGIEWAWLEPTLHAALERFPWLETVRLDRGASWFGHYLLTPDQQPIVGPMPGVDGWLNACGFSGHGIMQAAAIARLVDQEVAGEPPLIDLAPAL